MGVASARCRKYSLHRLLRVARIRLPSAMTRQRAALAACHQSPASGSEFTFEQLDRLYDAVGEMEKARDNRFEFGRPKLLKRHLGGELRVHLHMGCRVSKSDGDDFCAAFSPDGRRMNGSRSIYRG